MEPRRQKIAARLLLLLFAAVGLGWLASIDFSQKISTNVVDLIPADAQSPESSLLRSLADERQARVALFALTIPRDAKLDAFASPDSAVGSSALDVGRSARLRRAAASTVAQKFAASLRQSPLFAEAVPLADTSAHDALGAFIYQHRLDLLLPSWLAAQHAAFAATGKPAAGYSAWLAEKTVAKLDAFLGQPESAAFQKIIPGDPILLVPDLAQRSRALSPADNPPPGVALVWARLAVAPLAEAGQEPVFAVIDHALADTRRLCPGVTLDWTGVNRFAADSRQRIRAELSTLNTLSLVAVLAIALLFVRRVWKALHLVPVILFSLLGGWVAVTLCFARVHILVFVLGALLAGVAIDYGFYLYLQPPLRPGEPYREKLARLLKPLLTSCLTTVIGFSFLLFSQLPLIRQLGVFVGAGLLCALAAAILYFAQLDRPYLEARALPLPKSTPRTRRLVRILGLVALAVALAGPWFLRWHDDIHQLEIPDPALLATDAKVRALFGDNDAARSIYITRGDSLAAARSNLAAFQTWHDRAYPAAPLASVGLIFPTRDAFLAQPAEVDALADFPQKLRAALDQHGYTPEAFAPFLDAWRTHASALPALPSTSYSDLGASLQSKLTGPLGMTFFTSGNQTWFLSLADHPPSAAAPPAELHTVGTGQLRTLNSLFTRYRTSALHLSLGGLGLIGASVFVLYGLRRGVRIFMIPCGACFIAFGLLGLAGATLNLFHLLGAFLGVCLSHNYAIFSAENAGRGEPPPVSIRLSALCTAASFGVLALSKIPVVAALGSTVALIVVTALLLVELEPLGRKN